MNILCFHREKFVLQKMQALYMKYFSSMDFYFNGVLYKQSKCVVTLNLSRVFMRGVDFIPRIF